MATTFRRIVAPLLVTALCAVLPASVHARADLGTRAAPTTLEAGFGGGALLVLGTDGAEYVQLVAADVLVVRNNSGPIAEVPASDSCEQATFNEVHCDPALLDPELEVTGDLAGGDDVIEAAEGTRFAGFELGAGADRATGEVGGDVLFGGPDADQLAGIAGDDVLFGEGGDDVLRGQSGDDTYAGGPGADVMTEVGNGGDDLVDYSEAGGPVVVTLDGVANDGGAEDRRADEVEAGIENVRGSRFDDALTGDGRGQVLAGDAGADVVDGAGGADRLFGDAGADTLRARDGVADAELDCDRPGGAAAPGDTAVVDAADPEPVRCATVDRATPPPGGIPPGGGGGGGAGGGDADPPAGPAGPTRPAPGPAPPAGPQACLPPPLRGCVPATPTVRRVAVPDVRGLTPLAAGWVLARAGIEVDERRLQITPDRRRRASLPRNPRGGRFAEGQVIAQSVAPGTVVAAGGPERLRLDYRVWEGPGREGCAETARELAGLDVAAYLETLREYGCRVDDVRIAAPRETTAQRGEVDLASGDRCEVVRATRASGRTVDATLAVPDDAAETDLRIGFKDAYLQPSLIGDDAADRWKLPVVRQGTAQVVVTVRDRSGAPIDGVRLYVDATPAGGGTSDGVTSTASGAGRSERGSRVVTLAPRREGRVRFVAIGTDRTGASVCGTASLAVADPGAAFTSVSGNAWRRTADGAWRRDAGGAPRARAAQNPLTWVVDTLVGLFRGKPEVAVTVREQRTGRPAQAAIVTHGATVEQLCGGGTASGRAPVARTSSEPRSVLVTGDGGRTTGLAGGRVIGGAPCLLLGTGRDGATFADPARLIGADGATLIGADGATLIGADGATLIGADGATLIGADGATLVGNNGNTAVPAAVRMADARIISKDGAGIISKDGAGIVAAGGGNLAAVPAGAMVSRGG